MRDERTRPMLALLAVGFARCGISSTYFRDVRTKKKRNPQRVTQLDKSNVSGASLLTGTIEAPRVRYGSIPP